MAIDVHGNDGWLDPNDPNNQQDSRTPYGPQNEYAHMLNWLLQRRDSNLYAPQTTPEQFGATNWSPGRERFSFNDPNTAMLYQRAQMIADRIRSAHGGMQGGANLQTVTPPANAPHFTPHELSDAQLMSSRQVGNSAVQQQQKTAALNALLAMSKKPNRMTAKNRAM